MWTRKAGAVLALMLVGTLLAACSSTPGARTPGTRILGSTGPGGDRQAAAERGWLPPGTPAYPAAAPLAPVTNARGETLTPAPDRDRRASTPQQGAFGAFEAQRPRWGSAPGTTLPPGPPGPPPPPGGPQGPPFANAGGTFANQPPLPDGRAGPPAPPPGFANHGGVAREGGAPVFGTQGFANQSPGPQVQDNRGFANQGVVPHGETGRTFADRRTGDGARGEGRNIFEEPDAGQPLDAPQRQQFGQPPTRRPAQPSAQQHQPQFGQPDFEEPRDGQFADDGAPGARPRAPRSPGELSEEEAMRRFGASAMPRHPETDYPSSDPGVAERAPSSLASGLAGSQMDYNVNRNQLPNMENTLYAELPQGRVVIKMRPDLAPRHVARIKELTRAGFYDGVPFWRVIDGFMAQTGDPSGTGFGGSGRRLEAEFSDAKHIRGTVSMARGENPDSADSQFFILYDEAPWLDDKYTIWGEVLEGMEYVEALPTGDPDENGVVVQPGRIIRMNVAADVQGN